MINRILIAVSVTALVAACSGESTERVGSSASEIQALPAPPPSPVVVCEAPRITVNDATITCPYGAELKKSTLVKDTCDGGQELGWDPKTKKSTASVARLCNYECELEYGKFVTQVGDIPAPTPFCEAGEYVTGCKDLPTSKLEKKVAQEVSESFTFSCDKNVPGDCERARNKALSDCENTTPRCINAEQYCKPFAAAIQMQKNHGGGTCCVDPAPADPPVNVDAVPADDAIAF